MRMTYHDNGVVYETKLLGAHQGLSYCNVNSPVLDVVVVAVAVVVVVVVAVVVVTVAVDVDNGAESRSRIDQCEQETNDGKELLHLLM